MFRNVLVAVDGSATSNRGFKVALALARDQKAALHVVHVVEQALIAQGADGAFYVPPAYVDTMLAALREAGAKLLVKVEAVARKQGQKVATTALVENLAGSVADAIVRHARKVHADVIVLGTHGRRGITRLLMGSDAEAVLRESRAPVLLVRAAPRVARPATASRRTRSPRGRRTTIEVVRTSPTP